MKIVRWIVTAVAVSLLPLAPQAMGQSAPAGGDVDGLPRASEPGDDKVALIRELMRRRGGDGAAAAQLIQLAREYSPATTAGLFEELATAHQRAGDINLAAQTRQLLVEQFPDEPAAAQATLWLVRLYASSEVAWAHRPADAPPKLGTGTLVPSAEATTADGAASNAGGEVAQASATSDKSPSDAAAYALFVANKATVGRPAAEQDPALVFQRSVAARLAGEEKLARGYLSTLKHGLAGNPWCDAARVEGALADSPKDPPPKAAMRCALAATPPRLDGKLDDACWQAAALGLGDPAAKTAALTGPAEVRLAYDGEFLYVGLMCAKARNVDYRRDDSPRTPDGADDQRDRVRLLLDLDRDYATWYELTVDSRGWPASRCWDDASWNPEWFMATDDDAVSWTAEIAIPLAELAARPPRAGDAWACQIERRAPGAGSQAWPEALPREPTPAQFGLLLFDAGE